MNHTEEEELIDLEESSDDLEDIFSDGGENQNLDYESKESLNDLDELSDECTGITKPAIRRLAKAAGVKRIQTNIRSVAKPVLQDFMKDVISYGIRHARRSSRGYVSSTDIILAVEDYIRTRVSPDLCQ